MIYSIQFFNLTQFESKISLENIATGTGRPVRWFQPFFDLGGCRWIHPNKFLSAPYESIYVNMSLIFFVPEKRDAKNAEHHEEISVSWSLHLTRFFHTEISHTEIFWWQKIGKPRKNLRSSWNGRGSWVPVLQFFVCFCGDRTWVTNGHWWIIGMTNRINKVMGDQWFMDLWVYIGWLSLIILTPTNIDPAKQGAG